MSKKLAEKWAEEYMQTEEFKKEVKRYYGVKTNPFPTEEARKRRAKLLVEGYMQTEEGIAEKEMWDKELQEFLLYGTPTKHLNDELIAEIINYGK